MNEAIEDAGLLQLKEYRNALRTDLSVALEGAWQADWSYSDRLLATLQTLLEREGLGAMIKKARGIVADELKEAK